MMNLKSMKIRNCSLCIGKNSELHCLYIVVVFVLVALCGFVNKIVVVVVIIYYISLLSLSIVIVIYYILCFNKIKILLQWRIELNNH